MSDYSTEKDALRPCPTCRALISVLAVRCRHCGAEAPRPRKEAERLTIHDLGGVSENTYTVSGNVMEALEAFRAEEMSSQEVQRRQKEAEQNKGWFGQKPANINDMVTPRPSGVELPGLDEAHRNLASLGLEPTHRPTPKPQVRHAGINTQALSRKLMFFAGITASLVIIYMGTDMAWGKISEYIANRNAGNKIVYESKARELMEKGDFLGALRDANEALKYNKTDENQEILKEARTRFISDVLDHLKKDVYNPQDHSSASDMTAKAFEFDSDASIRELRDKVSAENTAYSLVCTGIDPSGTKATFSVNSDSSKATKVEVEKGNTIGDRFVVAEITPKNVLLKDKLVQNKNGLFRSIVARPGSPLAGN
jgi:hypothetical protein